MFSRSVIEHSRSINDTYSRHFDDRNILSIQAHRLERFARVPAQCVVVFTLPTSVFLTSWYYTEGVYIDVKYGCSWILDGLVSSHPTLS
jgi:hypothetical protein